MSGFPDDMPFFDEEPSGFARAERGEAAAQRPSSSPGSGIAARAMAARHGNAAPDYLAGLNPEQRLAVETTEGPVLVLAGAGTGKTRVLTTRIAHILATGRAYPSQILAVTFTNKAAREMKQRIGMLVGEAVEGHALARHLPLHRRQDLRRHAELAGLKSGFTILDTDDQIRLLKQLIQAEGLDDKRWPARQFAQMIDGWKNKGLAPGDIPEGDARAFANGKGRQLYRAYQERLQTLNACDFGDLLLHPIRIFAPIRKCWPSITALQIHSRRRISGHQHRPIHVAAPSRAAAPAAPYLPGRIERPKGRPSRCEAPAEPVSVANSA
jgi:DNA helicase-2/ATP-dependent DNA helicase PcrA